MGRNLYINNALLTLMSLPSWVEAVGKGGRRLSGGKNGTALHVSGGDFK
jgi:hypothetical protein